MEKWDHKLLRKEKAGIFNVEIIEVVHPITKKTKEFSRILSCDWVQVVAVTTNNEFLLVNQWRSGADVMSLEFPGGKIDEGEEPLEAAIRELREETGYKLTSKSVTQYLGGAYANPALRDNKQHHYLIMNVELDGPPQFDSFEYVEVVLREIQLARLQGFAQDLSTEMNNAMSVMGLLKALPAIQAAFPFPLEFV